MRDTLLVSRHLNAFSDLDLDTHDELPFYPAPQHAVVFFEMAVGETSMGEIHVCNIWWCFSPHFPASLKLSPECMFVSHVSEMSQAAGITASDFPTCLAGCGEAGAYHVCYVHVHMYSVLRHQNVRVAMPGIMVGERSIQA